MNIVKRNEDQIQRSEGASPFALATFDQAWQFARMAAASGMTPCKTPEQAMMVLAIGAELGLSPAQALQRIAPIRGRACPSADTLVAVVLASGLAEYFDEISSTEEGSTWETKRNGRPAKRYSYTMAEAKRAGLVRSDSAWSTFPKRMLAARAKAFLARDVYPDLLAGMYSQEEGPEIDNGYQAPRVVEEGTILSDAKERAVSQTNEKLALEIQRVPDEGVTEMVEDIGATIPSAPSFDPETGEVPSPQPVLIQDWVVRVLDAPTLAACDVACKEAIAGGALRDDVIARRREWQKGHAK